MSIGAIASRARTWVPVALREIASTWEPTGDTIFVSTAMNFTGQR